VGKKDQYQICHLEELSGKIEEPILVIQAKSIHLRNHLYGVKCLEKHFSNFCLKFHNQKYRKNTRRNIDMY
jgi:hypothetical protein